MSFIYSWSRQVPEQVALGLKGKTRMARIANLHTSSRLKHKERQTTQLEVLPMGFSYCNIFRSKTKLTSHKTKYTISVELFTGDKPPFTVPLTRESFFLAKSTTKIHLKKIYLNMEFLWNVIDFSERSNIHSWKDDSDLFRLRITFVASKVINWLLKLVMSEALLKLPEGRIS